MLEYIWHWFDYFRNRCSDISGGSSGSPVISRLTGRLLGLVNTTTIGAAEHSECFINHPCEAVPGDVASRANTSYMTPLVRVDRCFDEGGRFDAARQGCWAASLLLLRRILIGSPPLSIERMRNRVRAPLLHRCQLGTNTAFALQANEACARLAVNLE